MNRIAQLRKELNMSQADLAGKLSVHQTAVSQWEKGRTSPDFETVNILCDLFDVGMDYLLGRSDERRPYRMSRQDEEALGALIVQDAVRDHMAAYLKLDERGRHAVDLITMAELSWVQTQNGGEDGDHAEKVKP